MGRATQLDAHTVGWRRALGLRMQVRRPKLQVRRRDPKAAACGGTPDVTCCKGAIGARQKLAELKSASLSLGLGVAILQVLVRAAKGSLR